MSTRAECEKIGLRCVEGLLEKDITEDQLLKAGSILTASQYNDVVEERNIDSLCGYPLCDTSLGPIPTQKYHISLAKKKIFDLTERKKFCSDSCFKCSQYYAAQLSTTHLWLRTDTKKKLKLLPKDSSVKDVSVSKDDVTKSSSKPITQHHVPPLLSELDNLESLTITEKNTESFPKPQPTSSDDSSTSDEDSLDEGSELGDKEGEEQVKEEDAATKSATMSVRGSAGNSTGKRVPFPEVSHVSKLLSAISTWISMPQDKGPESLKEHKSHDSNDTREGTSCGHQGQACQRSHDHKDPSCEHNEEQSRSSDKDNATCDSNRVAYPHDLSKASLDSSKKIPDSAHNSNQLSHDSDQEAQESSRESHDPSKASHDSSKASHDSSKMSHRKKAAGGKGKSSKSKNEKRIEEGEPEGVFLPPVHSINVGGIQRSLFNSQLRQHLSGVCPVLGLSLHQVLPLVNVTTKKFRLNRHCITFTVAEWKILSLLLIIISCKDVESSDMLSKGPVKMWLQAVQATEQDFLLMLTSFNS